MYFLVEFEGSKDNLMILEENYFTNPISEIFVGKENVHVQLDNKIYTCKCIGMDKNKPKLISQMETLIKFKEFQRLTKRGHGNNIFNGPSKYRRYRVPVVRHDEDTSSAIDTANENDIIETAPSVNQNILHESEESASFLISKNIGRGRARGLLRTVDNVDVDTSYIIPSAPTPSHNDCNTAPSFFSTDSIPKVLPTSRKILFGTSERQNATMMTNTSTPSSNQFKTNLTSVARSARQLVEREGNEWHTIEGLDSLICVLLREVSMLKSQVAMLQSDVQTSIAATAAATSASIPETPLPISSEEQYFQFVADIADDHVLKRNVISILRMCASKDLQNSVRLAINALLSTEMQTKFNRTGGSDPRNPNAPSKLSFDKDLGKLVLRAFASTGLLENDINKQVTTYLADSKKRNRTALTSKKARRSNNIMPM